MPAPVLHTPRLTLRGHVLADLEALCDLFETDRARFMGGPLPRKEAWRWIASEVGMWDLRGFGYWGIETRDGSFVGQVGLSQPPHFPEAEIGWTLLEGAEGKGYATEAALAARAYAYDVLGWTTVISLVKPANEASARVAARMGAFLDTEFTHERWGHMQVWRHPAPADIADGGMEAYS